MWLAALLVILAILNFLLNFDMLPGGKKKPHTYMPSGRPVRINTSDAKNVPIRRVTWDRFRDVAIAESNKVGHKIYIPKALIPQPSNPAAMLAGDTRHNTIDLPMDIAGRYANWRGGGYPMLEQEREVGELRRQKYLLQRRVDRYSEPVDAFIDRDYDRIDRLMETAAKAMTAARESAGEMKRRG